MATPVHERRRSRRDEESSSRELFVPSNNLVRDKTDSARADAATDKNGGALQLEKISSSLESKFPELSFTLGRALDNDKQVLVVSQRVLASIWLHLSYSSYHPRRLSLQSPRATANAGRRNCK